MARVDNLLNLYEQSTHDERQSGKRWYTDAREWCVSQSQRYGLTLEQVAGVVAALSPLRSWKRNLEDAEYLLEAWSKGEELPFVHFGEQMYKVERILNGESATEVIRHDARSGHKCHNFLRNILEPDNPLYVTIDRWAMRALINAEPHRAVPTHRQYIDAVEDYYEAARQTNIVPSQMQAIIWVHIRGQEDDEIPF